MPDGCAHVLQKVGWLAESPEAFQVLVLSKADRIGFPPGARIYQQGDQAGGLWGVVEGRVELHLQGDGDQGTLAHMAGPGFWTGDLAAISGGPRRIGLTAHDSVQMLRLPRSEMLRITDRDPALWRHFVRLAAISLGTAIDLVDALRQTDPVSRLAAMLLNLNRLMPTELGEVRLSQADLGSLTGLSRGVVNAALATLEARGLLQRRYKSVVLTDLAGLESLTHGT